MSVERRAKKSLGQNFLIDPNQQRRIVAALEPSSADTVLEIGPGQGALTRHLAAVAGRLVLVELDDDLAADLAREYVAAPHVSVLHSDFMRLAPRDIAAEPHALKVVGNIPYNITTPIIFRLLEREFRPRLIVLMIQREVADRILAPAGTGEYGALSVGVRTVARAERLFNVGRGSFRPVPRVDSTVIRLEPLSPSPLTPDEESDLRMLTRVTFSWRRKQLQKTLRAAPGYDLSADEIARIENDTQLSLEQRPEQLDPDLFVSLSRALRRLGRPKRPPAGTTP
jgi:16S rRNA (adenine1518-N6/adenine1519-N6)-dimethyltransferase